MADPDAPAHDPPDPDELTAAERARLARWRPPGPSDGFADRVLAAPRARPDRRRTWVVAGALATVGAAAAAIGWWPAPSSVANLAASAPRQVVAARASMPIGTHAVAVAEPGAALAWRQVGAAALVDQDRGSIFYRVDRGGPFTVVTPVGEIRVTGTCFRVEILMSPTKHAVLGGALGAALAAAAVVTVYEGKVVVVGGGGGERTAVAGERITVAPGQAPIVTPPPGQPEPIAVARPTTLALELPAAPTEATTRDELLRRDKVQREQLAMLSQRIQELERAATTGGGGGGPPGLMGGGSWVDPTPAELAAWAKECRVRIDLPPVMRDKPMTVPPEWVADLSLSDGDVAAANQVFADLGADWARRVRALYVEATGDAAGADALSAHAMGQELQDKAAPHEPEALQKRVAQERAGLQATPADLSKTSPFERYFRGMAGLGDELERLLAAKVGADKAHAMRKQGGGWPMRMDMSGCADDDPATPR